MIEIIVLYDTDIFGMSAKRKTTDFIGHIPTLGGRRSISSSQSETQTPIAILMTAEQL